jgi:hypothetical protein
VTFQLGFEVSSFLRGDAEMHYSDYLREQAAEYRELAAKTDDPAVKEDFLDSAAILEEVANNEDDHRASG